MATKTRDASPLPSAKSVQETLLGRLAQRVRVLRAQRGMTRKQLAEQSGVSVPYLARVEGGQGNVSVALLNKLSVALNVPMQDFLSEAVSQKPDLTMLVQFLNQQSPATLARLRQEMISTPGFSGMGYGERIALIGLRGAGKSTLGALLAAQLDLPFVELDKLIEEEAGIAIGEVLTLYGQTGMRRLELRCIERIINIHPRVVLAPGGSIVAEAATYELLLRTFFTVWLKARPEVHFTRVMAQNDARIATSELQQEALEHIRWMLDARESLYQLTNATLDTSELSVEAALRQLVVWAQPAETILSAPNY